MIVDYIIVRSNHGGEFGELIVKQLNMSWQLYGDPYGTPQTTYIQAMVKFGVLKAIPEVTPDMNIEAPELERS